MSDERPAEETPRPAEPVHGAALLPEQRSPVPPVEPSTAKPEEPEPEKAARQHKAAEPDKAAETADPGETLVREEPPQFPEPRKPIGTEGAPEQEETAWTELTGRQRLIAGLWPPRLTRSQLIVAVLLFGLGFGLAVQVRSTNEHSVLRGARQEDLVRILSELDDRTERLEEEKGSLEDQLIELENSSDRAEEARKQTERREGQLGVLAGTVAAEGPGITVTVTDRSGLVEADQLLDTVQELRAAGAEAIQINGVRVVASTYFSDIDLGVRIDGRAVAPPYRVTAIGNPQDLEPALNIPGGVVQTLQKEQATVSVKRSEKVTVDALRSAKLPDYAQSSSQ